MQPALAQQTYMQGYAAILGTQIEQACVLTYRWRHITTSSCGRDACFQPMSNVTVMGDDDVSATHQNSTDALVLKELWPWLARPLRQSVADDTFAFYNTTKRSIFLLEISDGAVRVKDKPGFRIRDNLNTGLLADVDDGRLLYKEEIIRADMYRSFFEKVLRKYGVSLNATLAIDVNDEPIQYAEAPVFAFQKNLIANTILVPDVDFLHHHFYVPRDYSDLAAYHEKSITAVFAGSTTGGRTIDEDDVKNLAVQRLRSAAFFRDRSDVDFRLPRIVQCASQAVVEMIEALNIRTEPCSWRQQFGHRFIISMDGNGATCSRVAIALASQSALLKYDSPNLLYYFNELIPWRHYIPIASDEDVLKIVETERRRPGTFKIVADAGAQFARRYLSRNGVVAYTASLLGRYLDCFAEVSRPAHTPGVAPAVDYANGRQVLLEAELGAHIQGLGDAWAWPGEWAGERNGSRAIEAIMIGPPTAIAASDIEYRAILADGSLTAWASGGEVCGTRGCDSPLRGFGLRLRGRAAERFACTYSAAFTDGREIGPVAAGELCAAEDKTWLSAYHITIDAVSASLGNTQDEQNHNRTIDA